MELKKQLKTTPKYINILKSVGIESLKDLMLYFPRTYEDRKEIKNLSTTLTDGTLQTVKGLVTKKSMFTTPTGKKISQVHFVDEEGTNGMINSFRGTYMLRSVRANKRYYIIGKPEIQYGKVSFAHPEMMEATETDESAYNFGRIYPIYSELQGIKPARFARKIFDVLDDGIAEFSETYPDEFLDTYNLPHIHDMIRGLHFPETLSEAHIAKSRIFFEQLLKVQLLSLVNKRKYESSRSRKESDDDLMSQMNEITDIIIGISIEIHKKYGNTLTEKQYQKILGQKLQKEFELVEIEKTIKIEEDGVFIGNRNIDILVEGKIALELKKSPFIRKENFTQLRSYLELGGYPIGLLLNFGSSKLGIKRLEREYDHKEKGDTIDWSHIRKFTSTLPFTLTGAQKKAIKEIIEDIELKSNKPMMRLLQGDVGSGKTVVAAAAAYHIIMSGRKNSDNHTAHSSDSSESHLIHGSQCALLAPLSVLATQHYQSLAKLLLPLGVRVEVLMGSMKPKHKSQIKQALKLGQIDLIVGTHAIIQDDIEFFNLEFAIVDEQHKFGVRQRAFFQRFGSPHLLQMTATPIPRSLTLAFFGEFEVSIIDEMPAGRLDIITKIVSNTEIKKLKPRVLTKLGQGQKCFVVTPLIHESEKEGMSEIANASTERQHRKELYPELGDKIGLLHGQMKSSEKDQVMKDFKEGKYTILVSTTVIEVGVDISDATIMVIKNSERFGLSQLHQLRGRVGRNDIQSYCFLHTKRKSGDSYERLKHMEETNDGFRLAEIDLQLRGPGEMLGVMQSGETDIPLEILVDTTYLAQVQQAAHQLMDQYPEVVTKILGDSELAGMESTLV